MTRYVTAVGDEKKERILCHRCKKTEVIIFISPGSHARVLCHQCKYQSSRNPKRKASEVRGEAYQLLSRLASHTFSEHGVGPVQALDPASTEFADAEREFWANRRAEKNRTEYHYNTFGRKT